MLDTDTIMMLVEGTRDTLYMTLMSTLFGYVLGLPMGIILTVTDKDGIRPNAAVYKVLDVIVNILRSVPFLILLILVMPFTKAVVGKTYGSTATIVPLVIAAAPFIARMVESSLKEVDPGVIEGCGEYGGRHGNCHLEGDAGRSQNIPSGRRYHCHRHDPGILRYGGTVGGGGLGDIAIQYGYYRYETEIMIVTVVVLVVLVQNPSEYRNDGFTETG